MEFLRYLFDTDPGSAFQYYVPAIIFTVLIAVAAIAFGVIYKSKKKSDPSFRKLFKKTARNLWLFAGLFGFLIAIRYESIPYFSMRIWLVVSGLWFIFVLYKGIQRYRIDYKEMAEKENSKKVRAAEESESKKYLPNKKKRR